MTTHEQPRRDPQLRSEEKKHKDALLDEALAGSFPASDPTSTLVADEPVKSHEREEHRQHGGAKQKK